MNAEKIETSIEQFEEIQREAARIAPYIAELQTGERPLPFTTDEIILEEGMNLCAVWSTYDRCNDYRDEHNIFIPISYLFNDTIIEKLEEQIRIKKDEKEEKEKKEALDRKAVNDKRDYEKFMELAKKFGDSK